MLFSATPVVAVDAPDRPMISEAFDYSISFDNTGTPPNAEGYGPFIDQRLPEGLDLTGGATVYGQGIAAAKSVDNSTGATAVTFEHPFTNETITVQAGEEYYIYELPFGSLVPAQPKVDVAFQATTDKTEGALVDSPLVIEARGGFRFGLDPLNNPTTDPPIVSGVVTDTVTPTAMEVSKAVIAPEGETATGPNYARTFQIKVDIANGETVTDLTVRDLLPTNLQYIPGSLAVTGAAHTVNAEPVAPTLPAAADRDLELLFATVTGTTSKSDITIQYQVFVPEFDASGAPVLDPSTGAATTSTNGVDATATYDPDGPSGPLPPGTIHDTVADPGSLPNTATLTDRSLATQKSLALVNDINAAGLGPGDTMRYTIDVQASDFFEFANLDFTDLVSDGQRFDSLSAPTLTFRENGVTTAGVFDPSDYSFVRDGITGVTTLTFDVSSAMQGLGGDGFLTGDLARDAILTSGTVLSITYQTIVEGAFEAPDVENPSTSSGDSIGNNITVGGQVRKDDFTLGSIVTDSSSASATVPESAPSKSIYAVNGNVAATGSFSPGDNVTFRFNIPAPAQIDQLTATDFLPLPKFLAGELTTLTTVFVSDPTAYVPGALNAGEVLVVMDSDLYEAASGTDPLKQNITPTLSTNAASNRFVVTFGDLEPASGLSSEIRVFSTVTATDRPTADGLQLTNQLVVDAKTSDGTPIQTVRIAQIVVEEPVLTIAKGVVGYNTVGLALGGITFTAPNAASGFTGVVNSTAKSDAIDASNLSGNEVDGQDQVRFAIVLGNTGRSDAFDVRFQDQIPVGFDFPVSPAGMDLTLRLGDGTLLTQGTNYTFTIDAPTRTFSLELLDSGSEGALNQGKLGNGTELTDGKNFLVLTYDLNLASTADSGSKFTNTTTLTNYVGLEGSTTNRVPEGLDANAFVTSATPLLAKTLVGTQFIAANNSNTQAVIGEQATYRLVLTVAEGRTASAKIVDTLDAGLSYITGSAVAVGNGVTANVNASVSGQVVTFDLGDILNGNNSNATAETVTITYDVRVDNVFGNQHGTLLNNRAVGQWTATDQTTDPLDSSSSVRSLAPVSASNITVVEPDVAVSKTTTASSGSLDAGDAVSYTVSFTANASRPEAFETRLFDPLPSEFVSPAITGVTDSAGILTIADFAISGGGTLQYAGNQLIDMSPGRTISVTVEGTLSTSVAPNQVIRNGASVSWSSLDGDSPYERDGSDGVGPDNTVLNNYVDDATVSFTTRNVGVAKSIVATSEAHTSGSALVVGEIVRYRIEASIPEGAAPGFQVRDLLPTGLTFLNDGTSTVQAIGLIQTAGFGSLAAGALPSTPTVLGDLNISRSPTSNSDTYVSGTDVYFKLGSLTNPNLNNGVTEKVVIEFNAILDNSVAGGNDAGDVLGNQARGISDGRDLATSNRVNVQVLEPGITVDKVLFNSAGGVVLGGGEAISYTVTLTNPGGPNGSTAFDIDVSDIVPVELENVTLGTVTPSAGVGTVTTSLVGNTLTVNVVSMAPGSTVTFEILADVIAAPPAGTVIINTADLVFTSLPGPNGTTSNPTGSSTPGASGQDLGERDGSGGINDYTATDDAQFLTSPTVVIKVYQDGTLTEDDTSAPTSTGDRLQVGEQITFDLAVVAFEGTSNNLIVTDILPQGYRLDSYQILSTAGSTPYIEKDFNGSLNAPTVTGIGNSGPSNITFSFGNVTANLGAGGVTDYSDNIFAIRVTATALNIAANQDAVVIDNEAKLTFVDGGGGTVTLTSPILTPGTIVEPDLQISKTVVGSNLEAGDSMTFEILVSHTAASTAAAFDLDLADSLAAALLNPTVTAATLDGTDVSAFFSFTGSGLVTTPGAIDLLVGQTLTLRVAGVIADTATVGDTISNTVNLTWTSMDGAVADERTGVDGIGAGLNNYAATASVSEVIVGSLEIDKFVLAPFTTEVPVGGSVVYAIEVTLAEGTTNNLQLVDQLSPGMGYVAGSSAILNSGGFTLSPIVETYNPATNQITFEFASVVLPGRTNSGQTGQIDTGSFYVLYLTEVLNDVSVNQGSTLPNTVTATATNLGPDDANANVTVIEPFLAVSKTTAATNVEAGDTVTYVITVTHTGASNADAFDLDLSDTLPAGLQSPTIVSATIGATNVAGSFVFTGNTLSTTTNAVDLALGQTLTLTISGVVKDSIRPADTLSNTVDLTWTSTNGNNANERNGTGPNPPNDYLATATAPVLTVPGTIDVDKEIVLPADGDVTIGEVVDYRVTVKLIEGTTENVVLVDQLPTGVEYVAGSFQVTNAGGFTLSPASVVYTPGTHVLTITFATATAPGITDSGATGVVDTASFVIAYQARVLDIPANQTGTILTNTVTATGTNAGTDNDTASIPIVEPFLVVTKAVNDADGIVSRGQIVTYTLTYEHRGTSTAPAHQVTLRDAVPAFLQNVTVQSITGTAGVTGLTNLSAGNLLRVDAATVPLGGRVTVTFTAQVSLAIPVATTVDNNVRIYWDTLNDGDGNNILNPGSGNVDRDYGATPGYIEDPVPAPDDPAQDTVRITSGTLAVGDTIWQDQDRDGVIGSAENRLGGVAVWVDFNGDGLRNGNEPLAVTDASGTYLITGLAPGVYVIRVEPSTIPAGFIETSVFDDPFIAGSPQPGGFATVVSLTTSSELRADFGYYLPPPVVFPPLPPTPTETFFSPPASSLSPRLSALDTYFINVFNPILDVTDPTFGGFRMVDDSYVPYRFSAGFPLLSGAAEPGTNLILYFYNSLGELVLSNTVLVPSGGNWVASFPDAETSGATTVGVRVLAHDLTFESTVNNFNFRPNYITSMESTFVRRQLTLDSVFSGTASSVLESMVDFDSEPIQGGWTKRSYEFLAAPAVPLG